MLGGCELYQLKAQLQLPNACCLPPFGSNFNVKLWSATRKQLATSYPADLWGAVIADNRVKFGDPYVNLSREIPPEAI